MLEKLLTKIFKEAYPERDLQVEKIGKNFFLSVRDCVGCNDYLLKGTYTYDEVVELNKLTGYECGFGFCKELGPIAFIGVVNPYFCTRSGYFEYSIHEYGTSPNNSEYYFEVYSEEDAKQIGNYTVYGLEGLEKVATKAPIEKMKYYYDSRYKCKKSGDKNQDKEVIEMDFKLSGTYSFYDARLLATGTKEDKTGYSGEEHPILFAVVGENQYVGIINLWNQNNIKWFRGVWKYGYEEPKLQKIRFLSKEEAEKIENFTLYLYKYPFSLQTKIYPIIEKDRTFDSRFDFHLPDGRDYRLIQAN